VGRDYYGGEKKRLWEGSMGDAKEKDEE